MNDSLERMSLGGDESFAELCQRMGKKLSVMRKRRGLSQEELALRAGIDYRHFQDIERGKVDVKLSTLIRIATELGTDPGTFFLPTGSDVTLKTDTLKRICAILPCGIQMNDLNGVITFSNPAHQALHGYTETEMLGKMKIWDLLASPGERNELKAYFERIRSGRAKELPFFGINRKKDGSLVSVRVDWRYLYDDNGKLEGCVAAINPTKS